MAARPPPTQGPMASTWRNDPSKWTWKHRFLSRMDRWRSMDDDVFPIVSKDAPIPYMTNWSAHRWILMHAMWPMAVHASFQWLTGWRMHPVAVIALYTIAFIFNAIHQVKVLRRLAKRVGFLDGEKHPRDSVPDAGVDKVLRIISRTTGVRAIFTVFLAYRPSEPIGLSKWLPVELFLYSVVLDFFFYAYHRACHEVEFLWRYHKTHHLTKHPSPLLSGYADTEQEVIEIAIVPLLTYAVLKLMGFHFGFYDWWICHQYVIFSEAFGHSGLRVYATTAGVSSFFLKFFNCELQIEDHDLHHRHGWKKAANYGKQTLLWDRLFGTCGERIEANKANVDYVNVVDMPIY